LKGPPARAHSTRAEAQVSARLGARSTSRPPPHTHVRPFERQVDKKKGTQAASCAPVRRSFRAGERRRMPSMAGGVGVAARRRARAPSAALRPPPSALRPPPSARPLPLPLPPPCTLRPPCTRALPLARPGWRRLRRCGAAGTGGSRSRRTAPAPGIGWGVSWSDYVWCGTDAASTTRQLAALPGWGSARDGVGKGAGQETGVGGRLQSV
jgi:hypothetical protein